MPRTPSEALGGDSPAALVIREAQLGLAEREPDLVRADGDPFKASASAERRVAVPGGGPKGVPAVRAPVDTFRWGCRRVLRLGVSRAGSCRASGAEFAAAARGLGALDSGGFWPPFPNGEEHREAEARRAQRALRARGPGVEGRAPPLRGASGPRLARRRPRRSGLDIAPSRASLAGGGRNAGQDRPAPTLQQSHDVAGQCGGY